MTGGQMIFGSALIVALPLVVAWCKIRLWDWERKRDES